ncbi:MAG: 30S ribosomal protein S17 [Eggerthellaceae bacterium]|nr:30S ribosomal protein S17 [Eggerthellaceae bacterium]
MTEQRNSRKVRQGVVVSAVNDKTIVVETKERKAHPIYKKMMTTTKKFHAHDELNEAGVGDTVQIMETRPLSKLKRWRLLKIVEKAK